MPTDVMSNETECAKNPRKFEPSPPIPLPAIAATDYVPVPRWVLDKIAGTEMSATLNLARDA